MIAANFTEFRANRRNYPYRVEENTAHRFIPNANADSSMNL